MDFAFYMSIPTQLCLCSFVIESLLAMLLIHPLAMLQTTSRGHANLRASPALKLWNFTLWMRAVNSDMGRHLGRCRIAGRSQKQR